MLKDRIEYFEQFNFVKRGTWVGGQGHSWTTGKYWNDCALLKFKRKKERHLTNWYISMSILGTLLQIPGFIEALGMLTNTKHFTALVDDR